MSPRVCVCGEVGEWRCWLSKCWGMAMGRWGLMTIQMIARIQAEFAGLGPGGRGAMMELASACSSCVEGVRSVPPEPSKKKTKNRATLSTAPIPAVVNHLPPQPSHPLISPPFPCCSLSIFPTLICKRRLIRAPGPWWNFAVIVPNFSNIFYCLHHSFTAGRRGGSVCVRVCVSIMQMMLHTFCRLLHSVGIVLREFNY